MSKQKISKALPDPISLSLYVKENEVNVTKKVRAAFKRYDEDTFQTEDQVVDLFVDEIIPNFGYEAKKRGDTFTKKGQKPDVWVYPKGKKEEDYILIETIKKKASFTDFDKRKKRKYRSKSGLWIISNGVYCDIMLGEVEYCRRLDLRLDRDKKLFASLFFEDSPVLKEGDYFKDLVDIDSKVEKHLSKTISDSLSQHASFRYLATFLIVYSYLEQNNYFETTTMSELASLSEKDSLKYLMKLIGKKSPIENLDEVRKKVKKDLSKFRKVGAVISKILTFQNKLICYRNLDAYSFSNMYELAFNIRERKSNGIYVTPKTACIEITKRAYKSITSDEHYDVEGLDFVIVDPACGAGNFCEAAIQVITENVDYGNGSAGMERRSEKYNFIIKGQDINLEAVCFAEAACIISLAKRKMHDDFVNSPLSISFDFSHGDSTESKSSVYKNDSDYILYLGNPPYVKQTKQGSSKQSSSKGKVNLGNLILQTMVDRITSPRCSMGILYQIALVGNQNLDMETKLKDKELQISDYLYFGQNKLFTNTSPQKWGGIVWTNNEGHQGEYVHVRDIEPASSLEDIDFALREAFDESDPEPLERGITILDSESFSIHSTHNVDLAKSLLQLREESVDCEAGIQASSEFFDGKPCFQVPNGFFKSHQLNKLEKSYLKKIWTDCSSNHLYAKWTNEYLIDVPKEVYKDGRKAKSWKELQFKKDCPTLYRHLNKFKSELVKTRERASGSIPWWAIHWPRGGRIYKSDKLIIPQMINWDYPFLTFVDNEGLGAKFSYNVIWPKKGYRDDWKEALAGWLNSSLIAFYLKDLGGAKPRGADGEITGNHLKKIPIPMSIVKVSENEEVESRVLSLIELVKKYRFGFDLEMQSQVDLLCMDVLNTILGLEEEAIFKEDILEAA